MCPQEVATHRLGTAGLGERVITLPAKMTQGSPLQVQSQRHRFWSPRKLALCPMCGTSYVYVLLGWMGFLELLAVINLIACWGN